MRNFSQVNPLRPTLPRRLTPALAAAMLLAATLASAQTPQPTSPRKAAVPTTGNTTAKTTAKPTPHRATSASPALPPGIPRVAAPLRIAYALRFQEIRPGTGSVAQPGQVYTVHYTGWLASDGTKFDSSYDHHDPQHASGQPIQFIQGSHRVIPGWDTGFQAMRIGGKRRLFIPYQLAYGEAGRPPVIPPHSDLIFDVELVNAEDLPHTPPIMPGMNQPYTPNAPRSPPQPHAPPTPSSPPQPQPPPTPPDR